MTIAARDLGLQPAQLYAWREKAHRQGQQVWGADITYIDMAEGWLYLAAVLDLYSCKIVGWSMSDRMTAVLVCDALRMVLFRRHRPRGVIMHSDRGSQYCSREHRALLTRTA